MTYIEPNDIPIKEVLMKYGNIEGEVRERDGIKCRCPIPGHNDSDPSFKMYEADNTFHCFGCGKAGGPVDLLRFLKGLASNKEAESFLRRDFDIDTDAIPALEVFAEKKGLSCQVLEALGWRDVEQGIYVPYGAIIPEQGEVTYRIRKRYTGSPKYIKDNKGINIPYGLNLLAGYSKEVPLYITEGETDMVTLYQAGFQAIGIPGASLYNADFNKYIKDFTTLVVVIDTDTPGRHMLSSIIEKMEPDMRIRTFFIEVPGGVKDINEYHTHNCYSNIEVFTERFTAMPVVPATEEGFKVLIAGGVDVVNEAYIRSYARVRLDGEKMGIEKFAKRLYDMQGKALGVTTAAIKQCATDAVAQVLMETQQANEAVLAVSGSEAIKEDDGCYKIRKLTPTGFVYEAFTNFVVNIQRYYKDEMGIETASWELIGKDSTYTVTIGADEKASAGAFLHKVCGKAGFMYRVPAIAGFHQLFMQYVEDRNAAPRCYLRT